MLSGKCPFESARKLSELKTKVEKHHCYIEYQWQEHQVLYPNREDEHCYLASLWCFPKARRVILLKSTLHILKYEGK